MSNACFKQNKTWIKGLLCLFIFIAFDLFFLVDAVKDCIMLSKWDSGGIQEYQGEFTVYKKEYPRNTNYIFTLDNRDIIYVPGEYFKESSVEYLMTNSKLNFQYTVYKDKLGFGNHKVVSIVSLDGKTVFIQKEYTKGLIQLEATVYFIIGIICLLITNVILVFFFIPFPFQKNNNKHKRKGHTRG